jgi:hypothetical protein
MIKTLSTAAEILRPMAQAVSNRVRSLYQERQAGQMPFSVANDLLERGLDETLGRLHGGNVDAAWWRNLLARLGQQFVAPDFLRKPALQEWLTDEQARTDVKALARARILGATADDAEARLRLGRAYSQSTGEHERLAEGPIEVVLAILVAGYLASINSSFEPLAGMLQGSARESREASREVQAQLGDFQRMLGKLSPDTYVVQAHSDAAKRALDLLCKQRSLSPASVRQEIRALAQRVTDGDLCYAEPTVCADVYYWTARVHATQPETLATARQYLEQLRQRLPGVDTRTIEALILEAEGDVDGALRILRDIDTPDGRATLFGTLVRTQGAEFALLWFDDQ